MVAVPSAQQGAGETNALVMLKGAAQLVAGVTNTMVILRGGAALGRILFASE
jgi:hypothetical protein